jgi:hypothetical protein
MDQLEIGLNMARRMGATHAIITGKADPTQENREYLYGLIRKSREYLPLVDLHTNGYLIHPAENLLSISLDGLKKAGLTMITFSVASFDCDINRKLMKIDQNPQALIELARSLGLLVRCSLVVNKQGAKSPEDVMDYIVMAGSLGAHMVVVREVWVPDIYSGINPNVYAWNKDNFVPIRPIEERFVEICGDKGNPYGLHQRDPLPWGTPVFTVSNVFTKRDHGVNITFACCDEATSGPILKSIVHKPNGRGYRGWDCPGDYLY